MATKEENVARLQELAVQLGREPDISGTAAEISQRVAEWEEEACGMPDREHTETTADTSQDEPGAAKVIFIFRSLPLSERSARFIFTRWQRTAIGCWIPFRSGIRRAFRRYMLMNLRETG